MKINQVEELVGITKKNIRFYEEENLLSPKRNPENSYRDYSPADVEVLRKIKLLRKLYVPIEEIRILLEGKQSFSDCMERQVRKLVAEQQNLEKAKELCTRLSSEMNISELKADSFLEEIDNLEKEGTAFMDVRNDDVKKKKYGAVISAVVIVSLIVMIIGIIVWASMSDPIPIGILAVIILVYGSIIVGVVIALVQRMKEIDKGEENEASKY